MDDVQMTISTTAADGSTIESPPFTGEDLRKAAGALDGKSRMKPDPDFDAARDKAYRVTAGELRQFIERFERLEIEKKDIADQQKEVMAEAKARGYCVKTIRKLVSERKKSPDQRAEEDAVFSMYAEALGL